MSMLALWIISAVLAILPYLWLMAFLYTHALSPIFKKVKSLWMIMALGFVGGGISVLTRLFINRFSLIPESRGLVFVSCLTGLLFPWIATFVVYHCAKLLNTKMILQPSK